MRRRVALGALAAVIALAGSSGALGGRLGTVRAEEPNVVIEWNQTMVSAVATSKVAGAPATRLGAIVQAAVFDAVNGIERRYTSIHVAPAAPRGASKEAAVANAAYTALVSLFPAQKPALDADLAASLAAISDDEDGDSQSIASGLAWGETVAEQIVAWRAGDGFNATLPPYAIGSAPGDWQPTPPLFGATPAFRTLATTTPFALTSPSQFRPAGHPALTSSQYTTDFNEVKAFGSLNSTVRSPFQTETAIFWALDSPTGMWNRVADALLLGRGSSLSASAHLLAQLNIAEADASIAIWDAKNAFNTWRPVTAIAQAAFDGNPDTSPDATWAPLLATPVFQEYPSGHSGVSSAAASILASFFGEHSSFTVTSAGLPNVTRNFTAFSDAVAQVSDARVFAGFHFRFACNDAADVGASVASYVEQTQMVRIHGK
jgi:hypothetical protein